MSEPVVSRVVARVLLMATVVVGTNASLGATVARDGSVAEQRIEQQVERLVAFARLYGYVRFFHPSDQAAQADWDLLAVHGAEKVMELAPQGDIGELLRDLFVPLAPTLELFPSAEGAAPSRAETEDADGQGELVAWQHLGVGLGPGRYQSARSNRERVVELPGAQFGTVTQAVEAVPLRGRKLRLRAAVRAEVQGSGNQAQLWLRVDRAGGQRGFFDNMGDRPITSETWASYEIHGVVAEDAEQLMFGGFLAGSGKAWFDAFELSVGSEEEGWRPVALDNPGFEPK